MPPSLTLLVAKFGQLFDLISDRLDDKLDKKAPAQTALKLNQPFTLNLEGGCSGSVQVDGSGNATMQTTLHVEIPTGTVYHEAAVTIAAGDTAEFPITVTDNQPEANIRIDVKVKVNDSTSPLHDGYTNAEGVASWGLTSTSNKVVVTNHSTESLEFWVYIAHDPRNS